MVAHPYNLITLALMEAEHKFQASVSQKKPQRVGEVAQLVKCLSQGVAACASNPTAGGSPASWSSWNCKRNEGVPSWALYNTGGRGNAGL